MDFLTEVRKSLMRVHSQAVPEISNVQCVSRESVLLESDSSARLQAVHLWTNRIRQAVTTDELMTILDGYFEQHRSAGDIAVMKAIYQPILLRFFINDTGGWLIDGMAATPSERLQIEKYTRGWGVKRWAGVLRAE